MPYGLTGALLSGWPAVAFIGSAEMAIGMARRVATPLANLVATPVASPVATPLANPVATERPAATRSRASRTAPERPAAADTEAAVMASPDKAARELATELGVSARTVRRIRSRLASRQPDHNPVPATGPIPEG